jgi:hypothetical protein
MPALFQSNDQPIFVQMKPRSDSDALTSIVKPTPTFSMARTKQTTRKSTSGKAPRKQLTAKSDKSLARKTAVSYYL